jgi:hypothetical protein
LLEKNFNSLNFIKYFTKNNLLILSFNYFNHYLYLITITTIFSFSTVLFFTTRSPHYHLLHHQCYLTIITTIMTFSLHPSPQPLLSHDHLLLHYHNFLLTIIITALPPPLSPIVILPLLSHLPSSLKKYFTQHFSCKIFYFRKNKPTLYYG